MTYFYLCLYVLCCVIALAHLAYFRHDIPNTRGALLFSVVLACVPVVNIALVVWHRYVVKPVPSLADWLRKPFR